MFLYLRDLVGHTDARNGSLLKLNSEREHDCHSSIARYFRPRNIYLTFRLFTCYEDTSNKLMSWWVILKSSLYLTNCSKSWKRNYCFICL